MKRAEKKYGESSNAKLKKNIFNINTWKGKILLQARLWGVFNFILWLFTLICWKKSKGSLQEGFLSHALYGEWVRGGDAANPSVQGHRNRSRRRSNYLCMCNEKSQTITHTPPQPLLYDSDFSLDLRCALTSVA